MECKLDFTCENIAEKGELIDTLWNVNSVLPHGIPFCCICELIDTLWNVNASGRHWKGKKAPN